MNARQTRTLTLGITLLFCTVGLVVAQTGDEIFRQARQKEIVDGDIPAAIQLYERVVRDFSSNRALVAQSLLQLGECYERLNQQAKSLEYFHIVVDRFGDQTDAAARAAARMAAAPRIVAGIFIAAMDPRTGVIRQPSRSFTQSKTADESGATWSPDGRYLSFRSPSVGNQTNTYVRPLEGEAKSVIEKCGGTSFNGHATWLPDGKSLFLFGGGVGTTGCLGLSDVGTGRIVKQLPFPNMPATNWSVLSPDGTLLYAVIPGATAPGAAITVTAFDFATLKAKSTFVPSPLDGETMGGGHIVDISPDDGRYLALIRSGNTAAAKLVRFTSDFQKAEYRELVAGAGQLQGVAWSKDGRRIYFAQSIGENKWRLMQIPADGGMPSFTGLEVSGPLRYFDLNRENTQIAFDALSYTITPISQ